MASAWLFIFFFSFQSIAADKPVEKKTESRPESGWVMYFMPLQEFPRHTSRQYLREIRVILKQSKNKKLQKWNLPEINDQDFEEPVFKRIEWNRVATELNKYCLGNEKEETCSQLALLRTQYHINYQKFVSDRKKWREKKLKDRHTK